MAVDQIALSVRVSVSSVEKATARCEPCQRRYYDKCAINRRSLGIIYLFAVCFLFGGVSPRRLKGQQKARRSLFSSASGYVSLCRVSSPSYHKSEFINTVFFFFAESPEQADAESQFCSAWSTTAYEIATDHHRSQKCTTQGRPYCQWFQLWTCASMLYELKYNGNMGVSFLGKAA